jgi:hypothetical protein
MIQLMVVIFGLFAAPARVSVNVAVPDPAAPVPSHAHVRAAELIVSPAGRPDAAMVEPVVAPVIAPELGVPWTNGVQMTFSA